jgi:hypothetical protein
VRELDAEKPKLPGAASASKRQASGNAFIDDTFAGWKKRRNHFVFRYTFK